MKKIILPLMVVKIYDPYLYEKLKRRYHNNTNIVVYENGDVYIDDDGTIEREEINMESLMELFKQGEA